MMVCDGGNAVARGNTTRLAFVSDCRDSLKEASMFCTACGKELREGDRFCAQCGKGQEPGAPPSAAEETGPRPKLMRAMGEKKIAGVCAGIARYFGWDTTLVRIAFLALIVANGIGLWGYLIAWIAMPRDDQQVPAMAR